MSDGVVTPLFDQGGFPPHQTIVVTAHAQPDVPGDARVMRKPIDVKRFVRVLDSLLGEDA